MERYVCSKCHKEKDRREFDEFNGPRRKRLVMARCKECRKDDRYAKKGCKLCACCQRPRPLASNHLCKDCNEASGLMECRKCMKVLPKYLCFFERIPYRCKQCHREHRRDERYAKLGYKSCSNCQHPRPLNENNLCKECNQIPK